jgi:CheY-like chemotaxis protein
LPCDDKDSNKMTGPSGAAAKRRVLVVEDEMLIGMLLEDMLTDLGHEVVAIVPRLKDAMAAVDRETYDLAILDVHLHGESAFPVADVLIAKGIPFVFATGYGERGLPENYRGRPVLQKPFAKGRPGARAPEAVPVKTQRLSYLARLCRAFDFCVPAAGRACLRRPMSFHGSRRRRASRFGRFSTVKRVRDFLRAELFPGQGRGHRRAGRARVE